MTDTAPSAALAVQDLSLRPGAAAFDLEVAPGTILGVAGLEGNGQNQFLEVLAGLRRPPTGAIVSGGKTFDRGFRNIKQSFAAGVAYVPRNRKVEGLFLELPALLNFGFPTLSRVAGGGIIDRRRLMQRYATYAEALGVTAVAPSVAVRTLSGGNQQKVLLARWLAAEPDVLLLNDPARGVDHATKRALHDIFRRAAGGGATVLLLSTEIEELLTTADEVIVFRQFELSGQLPGEAMSRPAILAAMFGEDHHDRA